MIVWVHLDVVDVHINAALTVKKHVIPLDRVIVVAMWIILSIAMTLSPDDEAIIAISIKTRRRTIVLLVNPASSSRRSALV